MLRVGEVCSNVYRIEIYAGYCFYYSLMNFPSVLFLYLLFISL